MKCVLLMVIALSVSSCSTQPKNQGDVSDLRMRAESQLDQGNRQADRGSLDAALILLDEALRLAVAADDPGLRVRAGLSRGNVLFSLGRRDEANAGWDTALGEAVKMGNRELEAVCRIHISRGKLLTSGAAQAVRDEVNRELAHIKSDRLYLAFAWTVIALAEKELGRYADAESAMRRSLAIHEKERNYELAAYDWFLTASFRSLAGNYAGARQALESAIAYDRRVENSWGLANDWRAIGDVHKKAGDREASRAAYLRAAEIFRAIFMETAAEETLSRIP
jgi:tetratricopeptide (TPR) repeat protein